MREKELRIALVCYGGVSLAVYMHGITKEIWRLAKASQRVHSSTAGEGDATYDIYATLLTTIAAQADMDLRIVVDILAGASAGGINAIFLGHAIASGQALDPLTELWLDSADVDALIDRDVGAISRFAKYSAVPFAWAFSARSGTIDKTVEPEHRAEIKAKLANFVRAPWLSPPFGGPELTNLILNAFDAMERGPAGDPLLPDYQPLDLFVTVTDFHGYPEQLRLNSPPLVIETEHRLTLSFQDPGGEGRRLADTAELVFAARATASFPGAFPPFQVQELDACLAERKRHWPGRAAFLARALPQRAAAGDAEKAVLIDGSVLHNAPFGPAVAALEKRPSRREVDRRFIYIDPKPGMKSVRFGGGDAEAPGFFGTIFGALSDIPREQPIRDNLETIDRMSARIRRLRRITESIRPEVEAAIERAVGSSFFLNRPTPARIAGWRSKAHNLAAREAGYAYAAYGQLKIATVVEEIVALVFRLGGGGDTARRALVRRAVWRHVRTIGLTDPDAMTARGARDDVVRFLIDFDLTFRTRRLRFVARRITETTETMEAPREDQEAMLRALHNMIGRYRARGPDQAGDAAARRAFAAVDRDPAAALAALARLLDLPPLDEEADTMLSRALLALPKADRRPLLLSYLGYSYFDIATLPLLQGEGLDEFDPIKVDRISPNDATAIRKGGPHATLKGLQFNSFGAFFSRAYRENDYLWGRLHGADRLIDIVHSAVPEAKRLPEAAIAAMKRDAFRAILAEEKGRLTRIAGLFDQIEREIG
jgi:patatin-related protein